MPELLKRIGIPASDAPPRPSHLTSLFETPADLPPPAKRPRELVAIDSVGRRVGLDELIEHDRAALATASDSLRARGEVDVVDEQAQGWY